MNDDRDQPEKTQESAGGLAEGPTSSVEQAASGWTRFIWTLLRVAGPLGLIGWPLACFASLRTFGFPGGQPLIQMPFGWGITFVTCVLILTSGWPFCLVCLWLSGRILIKWKASQIHESRSSESGTPQGESRTPHGQQDQGLVTRPWGRFLTLRMRALMAIVVVTALEFTLLARSARNERAVIAALESRGAKAWLGWEFKSGGVVGVDWPRLKSWEEFLGVGTLAGVRLLVAPSATDDDMANVSRLTSLSALDLSRSSITDVGLSYLRLPSDLYALYLDGTAVSDEGLSILRGSDSLHVLSLRKTRVVTAASVLMMNLKDIEGLDFRDTSVGDDGLDRLAGLLRLDVLLLGNTRVTDAGLKQLKRLKKLTVLSLSDTKVTDAGLRELKEMPQLEFVSLKGAAVTDAGVAELQRALPKLRIVR